MLDTASPEAARVYERAGWVRAGMVPDYALLPQGGFCDTTFYYRRVPAAAVPAEHRLHPQAAS